MTTPSLTPDGHMRWAPRDWLESLCVEQPDGTWLVQAPIWGRQEPLLYLLPDEAAKQEFLRLASRLVWLRIAFLHWPGWPVLLLASLWGLLLGSAFNDPLTVPPFIPDPVLTACALFGLLYLLWQRSLFTWLGGAAVTQAAGWKRSEMVVRRAEEWDALHLSNGWSVQHVLARGAFGITLAILMFVAAIYPASCHGIDILDPLVLDMDEQQLARLRCQVSGWYILVGLGAGLAVMGLQIMVERRRRAGRARPLALEAAR
jgi:hypothetical protein